MVAEGSANKKHLIYILTVYKTTCVLLNERVQLQSEGGKTTFSVCFEMEFTCYGAAKYRSMLCISKMLCGVKRRPSWQSSKA